MKFWTQRNRYMEQEGAEAAPGGAEGAEIAGAEGAEAGEVDLTPTSTPKWPDDWREKYAGEDEKKKNILSRYTSPEAAFDALISAKQKISEGGLKTPFPAEGTDEDRAAWRKENGLPEKPEEYSLEFESGLVIGEEDKPFVDEFLKHAHETNQTPDQVKANLEWYYDNQAKQAEEREQQDSQIAQETINKLHAEWGKNYTNNINRIHGLLDTAPEGLKDEIMGARLPDGTPLMSSEKALRYFANLATEINPATTLVPNNGGDVSGAIDDEIMKFEKMMGDKHSEYWKGPAADKNQQRYRELLDAKQKMQRKSA